MTLNEAQRRYLAEICGKNAEFVVSIVLIGQMVTGRLTAAVLVGTALAIGSLVGTGTWLISDAHQSEWETPPR